MLPPITLKQMLCSRAICSAVIDRVIFESVDSGMATAVAEVNNTGPVEVIYVGALAYYLYMYLMSQPTKKDKFDKLNQYVLSENGYRWINTALFILFLLIKNPLNAI
jgi:ABC-type Fe3+ transport system substrate-binding protein